MINVLISELKNLLVDEKIEIFEYPNRDPRYYLPCSFMLKGTLKSNQQKFESWGVANTKELALLKAIVEFIERLSLPINDEVYAKMTFPFGRTKKSDFCNKFPDAKNYDFNNSSGVALHVSKKKAKVSALNEVIERHVIIKALAEEIPGKKIDFSPSIIDSNYFCNLPIFAYAWQGPLKRFVVCMRIPCHEGNAHSFGCAENLEDAIKSAFLEMVPNIVYAFSSPKVQENANCFLYNKIDLDIFNNTIHNIPQIDSHFSMRQFYVNYFKPVVNADFLVGAKVISPFLQGLFKGEWRDNFLNPITIKQCKYKVKFHLYG